MRYPSLQFHWKSVKRDPWGIPMVTLRSLQISGNRYTKVHKLPQKQHTIVTIKNSVHPDLVLKFAIPFVSFCIFLGI